MKLTIITNVITGLFILLWAYVSFPKFLNLKRFRYVMLSQIIPMWLSNILFVLLPLFEIGVMFLLLFDQTRLLGMYISFLLMLVFTIYIGGAAFNFYKLHLCPCGKLFSKLSWKEHFLVNLVLTMIALAGTYSISYLTQ
ncbi:MauE/DoxX family redox-associated membrane protein [Pedobacter lusitanus]|uniref:MauE/DoxX family redox-associated membrane protein n=1 Tax=Pedobacter lusitanus TaxID=1503925 RepID=UPI0006960194